MSDLSGVVALPGGLSDARNVETVRYRVMAELPNPAMPPVGGTFAAWAWGTYVAMVEPGGPIAKLAEIDGWLKAGLIERIHRAAVPVKPRRTTEGTTTQ